MISFEFYVNSYMGAAISEKAFDALAERAKAVLARLERIYRVEGTEVERAMALCAMAEVLHRWKGRPLGVRAESVGSSSVQYAQEAERLLERELYRQAAVYLELYRGIYVE